MSSSCVGYYRKHPEQLTRSIKCVAETCSTCIPDCKPKPTEYCLIFSCPSVRVHWKIRRLLNP